LLSTNISQPSRSAILENTKRLSKLLKLTFP